MFSFNSYIELTLKKMGKGEKEKRTPQSPPKFNQ